MALQDDPGGAAAQSKSCCLLVERSIPFIEQRLAKLPELGRLPRSHRAASRCSSGSPCRAEMLVIIVRQLF